MTTTRAARLIEQTSADFCVAYYGMSAGDTWYHGGSSHNDDRLTATVEEDGSIRVTDGNQTETYTGPIEEAPIQSCVHDWLTDLWANARV